MERSIVCELREAAQPAFEPEGFHCAMAIPLATSP